MTPSNQTISLVGDLMCLHRICCNRSTRLVFLVILSHLAVFGYTQQIGVDIIVEKNVMIPADDGTLLATDIYRPASEGQVKTEKLPVLFQRTPYNKEGDRFVPQAALFASQGYIVAIQDLRGRYGSSGIFTKYNPLEASDGKTSVEFLSQLPYCDGKVVMWGTSYGAHTQADAAKLNPHGLRGMIINMGGMTNAWDHAVRQGGAFELGRELTWAWRQIPLEMNDPIVSAHFEREKIEDWYEAWPLRKGLNPLSIAPNFEEYFFEELTHGDYDDYWKETGINWQEYYDQTADVPMVHIGGWYDIFLRGTINNYLELSKIQTTPKWLIIGPWTHSGNTRTYAGDVDFGELSAITDFHEQYQIKWFNHLLRDSQYVDLPPQPIRLFIMGSGSGEMNPEGRLNHGGYWRNFEEWPPNGKEMTYYFHEDGLFDSAISKLENSGTTYTYDPKDPVPTLGGNSSARLKDGGYDQRERADFAVSEPPYLPLEARSDVVVFQTKPLENELAIAGPIKVKLFVSSSATDTDFTFKLIDVYPPSEDYPGGFDLNLTDAIVRMSYRNGRHTRDLINPGEVYEVDLEPFPTANVFKKGHRIRIDISSSNFPRWDTNPNTGEPLGASRRSIPADNTIFHDAIRNSHVRFWSME
ncbi:MAG: CocE/NonD family hydrolase [Saprospiraceae bacterium]|nr:CocE/NonD family hydrolase [Saprospiraceae bacterium]